LLITLGSEGLGRAARAARRHAPPAARDARRPRRAPPSARAARRLPPAPPAEQKNTGRPRPTRIDRLVVAQVCGNLPVC